VRRLFLALALVVGALVPATSAAATTPAPPPPAAAAPNSLGIRLLDAPTSAAEDPRARAYIVDHLAPGTVIHRRVEVNNTTAAVAPVALYPAAAEIRDGVFTLDAGRPANELSSWTTVDPASLSLAPGARATVVLTISVPADASPGERYAVLWAEQATPAPPGGGVTLVNRVGIRSYLSVGPGGPPPSSFTVDPLTAARAPDGHPMVTAQVHNTGGRALDMSGTLSLSGGPGALSAGPFPAQLGATLAPGQSTAVTISLDQQLPDGPWNANLTLKSGLLEQNSQARIQFPADPGAAAPVAPQKTIADHLGLLIGALALLAALVIAAVVVIVRRRRARHQAAQHVA
ncbi:MAG: hypothetical protein QOG20_3799, partial [Pseudonocardiales bacterium]|nr:hypothetical protein [Pseudonocardiales bacterium]